MIHLVIWYHKILTLVVYTYIQVISIRMKLQKITVVKTNYDILLRSCLSKMKNFDHEIYNIKKKFSFQFAKNYGF